MENIRWNIAQWFEKKWWNNYLRKKNSTEYLKWKKDYWTNFLNEIPFSIKSNSKILDVGCGPAGTFIISDQDKTNQWLATDPLIKNYEKLDVFKQENYPNVEFKTTNFEDFITETRFKTIFCINAINHFINIKSNLKKLNNLMETNGDLIISIDAHNYNFISMILKKIPLDILHPHQYTDKEYEKMFTENNLKIVSKKIVKKKFVFSYYVYMLKRLEPKC